MVRKTKLYRKIYPKAREFARREYVSEYKFNALSIGYYYGFINGVKAFLRKANKVASRPTGDYYKEIADEILGKPTIID